MTHRDEWNAAVGLRRAAISLIVRSALSLAIWCGVLWLVAPAFGNPSFTPRGHLITLGCLPPAFIIGWLMSWRLSEQAGFTSAIIIGMVGICVLAVVIGGSVLVERFQSVVDPAHVFMIDGITAAIALGFAAFFLLRES